MVRDIMGKPTGRTIMPRTLKKVHPREVVSNAGARITNRIAPKEEEKE